jgi:anaphase-promoting complex subunit 1
MAYGAAIGLLFLGGGTCTLGRSPEDIAALVLALFPRFPLTTSDNQHHLQALRHCYALAVVKRDIRAIDADTGDIVSVPLEVS